MPDFTVPKPRVFTVGPEDIAALFSGQLVRRDEGWLVPSPELLLLCRPSKDRPSEVMEVVGVPPVSKPKSNQPAPRGKV